MDDKPMEGWSAPVYHALASPAALLMLGVPQTFLILTFLGTLLLTMLWWRAALIGIAVYAIGLVSTQVEVQWWEMWQAYRRYDDFYEG
jgi:type IV secretory pathway TrbD component